MHKKLFGVRVILLGTNRKGAEDERSSTVSSKYLRCLLEMRERLLCLPLRVICGANKRPVRPRVYGLDVYPDHATYFNMSIRSKLFAAKTQAA